MSRFPLPDVEWERTQPYFEGAVVGELRLPRCANCAGYNWFPPERCYYCDSDDLNWEACSGQGSLFSYTVVNRAFVKPFKTVTPYVTALISLAVEPRVRLVSFIVDCPPSLLEMDMPLDVVFRPLPFFDEGALFAGEAPIVVPMFRPLTAGSAS